jgi:hypothetical protein
MVTKDLLAFRSKSGRTLWSTLLTSRDSCKGTDLFSRFVFADAPVDLVTIFGVVHQTVRVPRDFRPGAAEICSVHL